MSTLLALVSALSWACANASIKPSSQRFGTWGALVWAQLIGGSLGLIVVLIVEGAPQRIGAAATPLLVAGLAAAIAYSGLFEALRRGQVAVVTPIISAWSLISVAIAVLGDGAEISRFAFAGIALVVIGNVVLARSSGETQASATPRSAIAIALLSALGFGVMVPALDAAGASVGRLWTVPLVWGIELAVIVPPLLLMRRLRRRPETRRDWFIASRAAVFEVGGFISISLALGAGSVALVSPLSSLSTAFSVAIGLTLLRERLRPITIAGAVAASAGVVLVNL